MWWNLSASVSLLGGRYIPIIALLLLVALRELALREVADNIEQDAVTSSPTDRYCSVHERVLVCISTYPKSVQLLRRGARIATQLHARLYALFVIIQSVF